MIRVQPMGRPAWLLIALRASGLKSLARLRRRFKAAGKDGRGFSKVDRSPGGSAIRQRCLRRNRRRVTIRIPA